MKSIEEFVEKYGYNVWDKVVHYSYEHTPCNANLVDYTFRVEDINYEAEVVDVIDEYNDRRKFEVPARLFSKLPDFKIGDTVIVHKPINVRIYPAWTDRMDEYDGKELRVEILDTHVLYLGVFYSFNSAWLELLKNEPFESEILLDDFL